MNLKKSVISVIIIGLILCAVLSIGTHASGYNPNADYMALMVECAQVGTKEALLQGLEYEEIRNLKIRSEGLDFEETDFFATLNADEVSSRIREYILKYQTYYTESDVIMVAKILKTECGGVPSKTEQASVTWTICNRVDAGYAASIAGVILAPNAYAYNPNTSVRDDLYELAKDVLNRWVLEKAGFTDVGRVLPADYFYFSGDGVHNYFRNAFIGGTRWDYSLPTPYEN